MESKLKEGKIMKDVLALQRLNEGSDVQPEWDWTVTTVGGFWSATSISCN